MCTLNYQPEGEKILNRLEKYDSCYGGTVENIFSLLEERFEKLTSGSSKAKDEHLYNEVDKAWTLLVILKNHVPKELFEDLEQLHFITSQNKRIS